MCRLKVQKTLPDQASAGGLRPQASVSDAVSGSALGDSLAFFVFALGAFSTTGSGVSTGVSITCPPITVLTIFVAIKLHQLVGV